MLHHTDFSWLMFFVTCLPTLLIDNLNAPFPTMIGIMREIFDDQIEELQNIYLSQKGTPFEVASAVIVDIDQGKLVEIEEYFALKALNSLMEEDLQTAAQRQSAIYAEQRLTQIQQQKKELLVPSFIREIMDIKKFEHLSKSEWGLGNLVDIQNLAFELMQILQ